MNNKKKLEFVALGLVVAMALVTFYLWKQGEPARHLQALQERARHIDDLTGDKASQLAGRQTLVEQIDVALESSPAPIKQALARLGMDYVAETDLRRRLVYFEVLYEKLLLKPEERIDYIKLKYSVEGMTKPLEDLIAQILIKDSRQPDMMLVLAKESLLLQQFDLAKKAALIASEALEGEDQQRAREILTKSERVLNNEVGLEN